ncbi:MAG: hypothetical protein Q7S55_04815 [Nanoarchaeota archaeon]|nr:hypothetical protein [Nanoarchaeota archaeon]
MRKLLYAGIFSALLSGCARNITPIPPTYPFKIQRHPVFVDDQPGRYDIITINDILAPGLKKKYCYFGKRVENGEYLIIEDKDCDLDSDKVMVLSRDDIIVATDTTNLDEKVVGMLDYILRNHKKNIIDSDLIVF